MTWEELLNSTPVPPAATQEDEDITRDLDGFDTIDMSRVADGKIVFSQKAVARHFKVSPDTVAKWFVSDCPRLRRGDRSWAYDLEVIAQWKASRPRDPQNDRYQTLETGEVVRRDSSEKASALEQKRRVELEIAELKKQQLAQKIARESQADEYLPRHEVEAFVAEFFSYLRDRLMSIPDRLETMFENPTYAKACSELIEAELRAAALYESRAKGHLESEK